MIALINELRASHGPLCRRSRLDSPGSRAFRIPGLDSYQHAPTQRRQVTTKRLDEIQQTLREQKLYLAEKYGVEIVGVFGTYVRQEQRPDSDLDLLIELDRPPKISLIGLVEIEDYLSQILGNEVDLAIKTKLKKRIGRRILQEVIPV